MTNRACVLLVIPHLIDIHFVHSDRIQLGQEMSKLGKQIFQYRECDPLIKPTYAHVAGHRISLQQPHVLDIDLALPLNGTQRIDAFQHGEHDNFEQNLGRYCRFSPLWRIQTQQRCVIQFLQYCVQ